jgi:hypothetical protein
MRLILLLTAVFFVSSAAQAASDGLIEGAKQCTQYFPTEERSRDIPVHLLAAISTTETGRYHEGLGMAIPWPWTINVEGKGYYFGSKAEAIAATQKFLRQGKRSIDVGCMQVNLKHHANAFRNLNEAFDPATNVGYAAKFLRDNYDEMGNWIKAAAAYHSRTVSRGNSYLARVEKNWTNIVNKVRAAKGQQQVASADPAMKAQAATTRVLSHSNRQSPSAMRSIRMIEVNDVAQARRNDVLVIRAPQQAEEVSVNLPAHASISVASADAQSDMMVKTMPTRMQMMSIDKAPKSSISSGNKTFVFAN